MLQSHMKHEQINGEAEVLHIKNKQTNSWLLSSKKW